MEDNIYIIRTFGRNSNLIKVGYTSVINERMKAYYSHNPLYELIITFYKENGASLEKAIHSNFKSEVMNEWYKESMLLDIIKFIESYDCDDKPNYTYNTDAGYNFKLSGTLNKEIFKYITNEEYGIFMRLAMNTEKNSNKVALVNKKTTNAMMSDFIDISLKKLPIAINNLINNGLIDEIDGFYYVNTNFIKKI